MREKAQDPDYALFAIAHEHAHCWWCGRDAFEQPKGWNAPWLIERAHIVSSPRRLDSRAVVCLCSLCHRQSHGLDVQLPGVQVLPGAGVGHMLWLKRRFDLARYDRSFLQECSVARLPRSHTPPAVVRNYYLSRRGRYPG